jgi:protein phosphatase slingshot
MYFLKNKPNLLNIFVIFFQETFFLKTKTTTKMNEIKECSKFYPLKRGIEEIHPLTHRTLDTIDISKIGKNVWLGSYERAAKVYEGLKANGITHILTVGNDMPAMFPNDFTYKIISIDDSPESNLNNYFEECMEFIDKALNEKVTNQVLIHCWAGISRSASISILYRMKNFGENFTEAYESIRKTRYWINPNNGFRKQLIEYAEQYLDHYQSLKEINNYLKIGNILRKLYDRKQYPATEEIRRDIFETFSSIFGDYHFHTLHIQNEIQILKN